ncbi:MAG: biotin/lipoyl-binding protein [Cyanothece sp. SIO2G6]|nr:biotin/lipoyl-binding protein [Cyanothece sp. SIO2G6]
MKIDDSTPPLSSSLPSNPNSPPPPEPSSPIATLVPDARQGSTSRAKGFQPKSIWPIAILGMLVVLGGVGWKAYQSLQQVPTAEAEPTAAIPARLPVRVVRAEQRLAQQWVFDDGIVWPVRRRVLTFQADGDIETIAKVNGRDLRAGDYVTQGQLLATIDDRRQQSAIDTAQADLTVAIKQQQQSKAALIQAQANLDKVKSDLELAKTELVRNQRLFDEGVIAASDRDVYANQVDQAEAALRSAEQEVESAADGIEAADASITAAEARLRETKVDLEDTQLVAPIDGVVAYINIREGEYWSSQRLNTSSDQETIESAPIILVNPQEFEVELELQADDAETIRPGQLAYVVLEEDVSAAQAAGASTNDLLDIAQQQGSQGQVFSVSPTQTPGSRGTKVSIRNFPSVRNLRVGGRAYAWIEAATSPNAVMVPLGSLVPFDQNFYAFVVNPDTNTVEQRRVERGIEGLDGIEILSGIATGEWVVTEGANRLVDGTPVRLVGQDQAGQEADQ